MTSHTSVGELQAAIFTRLTGDTALMALVSGVIDFAAVPVNQPYPFVTIGDMSETPNNAFSKRGYDSQMTIHIWDSTAGFKRAQTVLNRVNELIDQQPLTLASLHLVYCLYQSAHMLNDPGVDSIQHIPIMYATFVQE